MKTMKISKRMASTLLISGFTFYIVVEKHDLKVSINKQLCELQTKLRIKLLGLKKTKET